MVGVMIFSLVALASFVAGFLNAVAGGGSFLTFPALIAAGLPPIDANASNTVALFPGQIATGYAARDGLRAAAADSRVDLPIFAAISLAGGFIGGILLLVTPQAVFGRIVPWLILFATAVFAGGNFMPRAGKKFRLNRAGIFAVQAVVAIYGGYFGGGIGFLLLAALTLYGMRDINAMNGLKMILVGLMTVTSMLTFASANIVAWPQTVPMLVGGYVGAHGARLVDQQWIKGFVIVLGVGLTVYFFWHGV